MGRFYLIILAGAVSIVMGAINEDAGFIAFGVAAVASAIIAWVSGATSKPKIGISSRSFSSRRADSDGPLAGHLRPVRCRRRHRRRDTAVMVSGDGK